MLVQQAGSQPLYVYMLSWVSSRDDLAEVLPDSCGIARNLIIYTCTAMTDQGS